MSSRSLFSVCLVLALGSVLCADVVYFNDFSATVGPNLSVTSGTLAIMQPFQWCSSTVYCTPFLGLSASATTAQPLDNHTVTLSLSGLPAHTQATVSLALFILSTWDGNLPPYGPDNWELAVLGGPTLLSTTFSNTDGKSQCYPANCPASNPRWTGSVEHNTLHAPYTDSVYLLSYTFPHTGSSLALTFRAWNLQGWSDEGWGMDNLRVEVTGAPPSVIPEPATFAMLAGVLLVLAALRRRALLK